MEKSLFAQDSETEHKLESSEELRLMSYIRYLAVSRMPIDPMRITVKERKMLQRWRAEGLLLSSSKGPVTVSEEFWNRINEALFNSFALPYQRRDIYPVYTEKPPVGEPDDVETNDTILRSDAVKKIKRYKHRLIGNGLTYDFLLEEFTNLIPSAPNLQPDDDGTLVVTVDHADYVGHIMVKDSKDADGGILYYPEADSTFNGTLINKDAAIREIKQAILSFISEKGEWNKDVGEHVCTELDRKLFAVNKEINKRINELPTEKGSGSITKEGVNHE